MPFLPIFGSSGSGTTYNIDVTDSVGITDTLAKSITKGSTDNVGITDTLAKSFSKGKSDNVGVTDTFSKSFSKTFSDTISLGDTFGKSFAKEFADFLTNTDSVVMSKVKLVSPVDPLDITDIYAKTVGKSKTETAGVTDSVAVSQNEGKEDSMGVTDSFVMQRIRQIPGLAADAVSVTYTFAKTLVKGFADAVGITDLLSITGGSTSEEDTPMSLVDDKRAIIGAQLGISGSALAALSIDDLLKMYWSSNFPALHPYDGFESGLPYDSRSTMDHFSTVEANKNTGQKDYIRDVV